MPEVFSKRALEESAGEVLEKMFFIGALEERGSDTQPYPEITTRVNFEGSPSGALTMRVAAAAARSIAADFLGCEKSSLSEAQVDEVMCELANMICGSVLSRTESETTFRLLSPVIVDACGLALSDEATSRAVEIYGGLLTVSIEAVTELCPAAEKLAS
jgi:CheY-specific phosphatase CheX